MQSALRPTLSSSFLPHKRLPRVHRGAVQTPVVPRAIVSAADIHLYSLTATDLFSFYATRAFITTHLPLMIMYRGVLRLPWAYTSAFTLFISALKCALEASS